VRTESSLLVFFSWSLLWLVTLSIGLAVSALYYQRCIVNWLFRLLLFTLGTHLCRPLATLSTQLPAARSRSPSRGSPFQSKPKSRRRDSIFVLMSISFGGLGVISLRRPFTELSHMILGRGEFRPSTLYVFIFCVVLLVIGEHLLFSYLPSAHSFDATWVLTPFFYATAYLTNPSENSFRAYLTEQSFRQHLSRLDDDHLYPSDDVRSPSTLASNAQRSLEGLKSVPNGNHHNSFHFTSRASVSLRTPKHIFHSFGIVTIAAVVPITAKDGNTNRRPSDGYGYGLIVDSWFIGAFGRWWRGGSVDAWYKDAVASSKAEEGWSSGILGMKALDRLDGCHGEHRVAILICRSMKELAYLKICRIPQRPPLSLVDPLPGYGTVNGPHSVRPACLGALHLPPCRNRPRSLCTPLANLF
jgi:hypothetical protein